MAGDEILRLLLPGHQAVLVQDHLHPLFPELPRVSRHVLVDALAQVARPRRFVEPGQLFLELDAEHFAAALVGDRWSCRRSVPAAVSHGGIVPLAITDRPRTRGTRAL